MELDGWQRESVARTAAGMLGYYQGTLNNPQIAQRIAQRYAGTADESFWTILATVNQQKQLFDRGQQMESATNQNEAFRVGVTDWALFSASGQYGYRVEVVTVNEATGDRSTRLVVVTSGQQLSPNDVRGQAIDHVARDPTIGGRYPELSGAADQQTHFATILTAGRNPV